MKETEKIDWHPAFTSAMRLELAKYKDYLKYIEEYQLTEKPLRIDVIVLNENNIKLDKNIASNFRKYNIIEYKSPTDYLSIDDYYKTLAYAYLFKGIESQRQGGINKVKINEITATLVSLQYPKKLINHLTEKGMDIKHQDNGIYYVKNEFIPTQILVQSKLPKEENEYLKLLTNHLEEKDLLEKIILKYEQDIKNMDYGVLLEAVISANQNISMEVLEMTLTDKNQKTLNDIVKKVGLDEKIKLEGKLEEKIENAKNLLDVLNDDIIAKKIGLPIEKVRELRKELAN